MCLQKFNATVFVPKLSQFSQIIEIDVDLHDSENDVKYKLIKKLDIFKYHKGYLLSTKSPYLQGDWSKLVIFEKISPPTRMYGEIISTRAIKEKNEK